MMLKTVPSNFNNAPNKGLGRGRWFYPYPVSSIPKKRNEVGISNHALMHFITNPLKDECNKKWITVQGDHRKSPSVRRARKVSSVYLLLTIHVLRHTQQQAEYHFAWELGMFLQCLHCIIPAWRARIKSDFWSEVLIPKYLLTVMRANSGSSQIDEFK